MHTRPRTLTPMQKRFIESYAVTANAAHSARVAGYSPRSGAETCRRMLHANPLVRDAVAQRRAEIAAAASLSPERFAKEVLDIARAAVESNAPGLALALRAWQLIGKHLGVLDGKKASANAPRQLVNVRIVPIPGEPGYDPADWADIGGYPIRPSSATAQGPARGEPQNPGFQIQNTPGEHGVDPGSSLGEQGVGPGAGQWADEGPASSPLEGEDLQCRAGAEEVGGGSGPTPATEPQNHVRAEPACAEPGRSIEARAGSARAAEDSPAPRPRRPARIEFTTIGVDPYIPARSNRARALLEGASRHRAPSHSEPFAWARHILYGIKRANGVALPPEFADVPPPEPPAYAPPTWRGL